MHVQPAPIHTGYKISASSWIRPIPCLSQKLIFQERCPGSADFQMPTVSRIPARPRLHWLHWNISVNIPVDISLEITNPLLPALIPGFLFFPFPWRVPEPFCSVFHLLAGSLGRFLFLASHPTGWAGRESLRITLSSSQGTFVTSPGAQGPHPAAPQGCSALGIFWECAHPCALCAFQRRLRLLELQEQ